LTNKQFLALQKTIEDDEDLEEGTFEDYEFNKDDLPSNSKIFKKPILPSNNTKKPKI
jgi:hypothetical protein